MKRLLGCAKIEEVLGGGESVSVYPTTEGGGVVKFDSHREEESPVAFRFLHPCRNGKPVAGLQEKIQSEEGTLTRNVNLKKSSDPKHQSDEESRSEMSPCHIL